LALQSPTVQRQHKKVRTNRVACAVEAPFCAVARIERNETVVERSNGTKTPERIWSVPTWLNIVRLDESGENLLVEAVPRNALPVNASADFVVLQIYSHGTLRREITLKDVLPDEVAQSIALRIGTWGVRHSSTGAGAVTYVVASGKTIRVELASATIHSE
jgi:hypothetical protein